MGRVLFNGKYNWVGFILSGNDRRSISSLVNSKQTMGYLSTQWNALGEPVSAGMYIYMIQAGEFRQVKKRVLLK